MGSSERIRKTIVIACAMLLTMLGMMLIGPALARAQARWECNGRSCRLVQQPSVPTIVQSAPVVSYSFVDTGPSPVVPIPAFLSNEIIAYEQASAVTSLPAAISLPAVTQDRPPTGTPTPVSFAVQTHYVSAAPPEHSVLVRHAEHERHYPVASAVRRVGSRIGRIARVILPPYGCRDRRHR